MNGPFITLEEVANIKGIGKKTIEKMRDIAYIGNPEPIDPEEQIVSLSKITQKKGSTIEIQNVPCGPGRININTASAPELETLPRIGPGKAAKIIADRETNGPFTEINDLTRVKGIGIKTLEKMKDMICAE
ncbi:ComEA family DNA-binding protein [bacterium]|nr:ComEA family DNA-binding protein [bacterium]